MRIPDDDKDMVAAVAEARRRIPEFKLLLKSPQDGVIVRVAVWSSGTGTMHKATLTGIKGDQLEVVLPPEAPPPHRKTIPIWEIHDWTVLHAGGKRSGGFTTRGDVREGARTVGQAASRLKSP